MDTPAGRLTALSRPIDLGVASNRFALFASLVIALLATVVTFATDPGAGALGAGGRGIASGLGVFLAWAITREVAPDHPAAARLAVAASLPAMLLGPPALSALFVVLLALRITVRTTGRAPTRVDLGVLVVLAAFASTSTTGFIAALALAYAVHADRKLPEPARDRDHEVTAVAIVAVALASTVVSRSFLTGWDGLALGAALFVVAVIAAATRFRATATHASDDTGEGLWLERLVHARRLLLVTLAVALLWAGGQAVAALAPAGAAIVGTAIRGLGATLPSRVRASSERPSEAA